MKLAISNIAWPKQHDEEMLRTLKQLKIDGLEIAPTRIISEQPYEKRKSAAVYAANLQETYGLHICSMQSIWFGKSENLFRSKKDIQTLTEYTKQAILFAQAIHCPNLVFGCPKNRNIEGTGISLLENVLDFFRTVGEYAVGHDTCFSIEPNPPMYHTNFINATGEAISLVKELNSNGIKVNLDLGTIINNEETLEEIDLRFVNHIHISEPGLQIIQNRPLHKKLFRLAKESAYKKYISIEMGCMDNPEQIKSVLDYVLSIKESV